MRAAALAAALALPAPALAQAEAGGWAAAVAQGPVAGDLWLWVEGQARVTGGDTQVIARPAAGWRFAPDSTLLAGYAYVVTRPEGAGAVREHRAWQQVQLPILRGPGGAPRLVSRTRIEQRMVEGAGTTGWRLRQFVRAQVPVRRGSAVQAVAYTEGFVNLNTADFGARAGVDQWRNFVGIGLPVGRRMRIEPGYLNQVVMRRGPDRVNHIVNATLFLAL